MSTTINNFVLRNTAFAWIALVSGLVLLVPLFAMRFTAAVNWDPMDFIVMGALLFGTGSLYVLIARKVAYKYWFALGVLCVAGLLYVWAELAVGILTNLGS